MLDVRQRLVNRPQFGHGEFAVVLRDGRQHGRINVDPCVLVGFLEFQQGGPALVQFHARHLLELVFVADLEPRILKGFPGLAKHSQEFLVPQLSPNLRSSPFLESLGVPGLDVEVVVHQFLDLRFCGPRVVLLALELVGFAGILLFGQPILVRVHVPQVGPGDQFPRLFTNRGHGRNLNVCGLLCGLLFARLGGLHLVGDSLQPHQVTEFHGEDITHSIPVHGIHRLLSNGTVQQYVAIPGVYNLFRQGINQAVPVGQVLECVVEARPVLVAQEVRHIADLHPAVLDGRNPLGGPELLFNGLAIQLDRPVLECSHRPHVGPGIDARFHLGARLRLLILVGFLLLPDEILHHLGLKPFVSLLDGLCLGLDQHRVFRRGGPHVLRRSEEFRLVRYRCNLGIGRKEPIKHRPDFLVDLDAQFLQRLVHELHPRLEAHHQRLEAFRR